MDLSGWPGGLAGGRMLGHTVTWCDVKELGEMMSPGGHAPEDFRRPTKTVSCVLPY